MVGTRMGARIPAPTMTVVMSSSFMFGVSKLCPELLMSCLSLVCNEETRGGDREVRRIMGLVIAGKEQIENCVTENSMTGTILPDQIMRTFS